MMKTYKHLFEKVCNFQNLLLAYRKARKGKRLKKEVSYFALHLEENLHAIRQELLTKTYMPGGYRDFTVYEPKERLISAAPFKDRVVHHAICNVIEPLFDNSFIYDTYACRKGKGTHKAIERCQTFVETNKYVLKCDIEKYFPSIDHKVLFDMLSRKIADSNMLWLVSTIIESKVFKQELEFLDPVNIFDCLIRKKGMPIGNLTSQFFANVYLNALDQFIKHSIRAKSYIRYMDDFLVFSNEKSYLHIVKNQIRDFLAPIKLRLHPKKCTVFPTSTGVDFLGFRLYANKRKIRKSNVKLFIHRLKKMKWLYKQGKITLEKIGESLKAWIAHASHADTYNLRKSLFRKFVLVRG